MKAFIIFLLIGVFSYVAGLWYPWWSIAVVSFIVTLVIPQKPAASFFIAFLSIFIFWFSLAFFKDLANDHILAGRMSELFLHSRSPFLIAAVTGLIGAIVAGLAALSAAFLRTGKRAKQQVSYRKTFN
jgi:hypothetical protein